MTNWTTFSLCLAIATVSPSAAHAQNGAAVSVVVDAEKPGPKINRDIFGQFSEMLGNGVYGGIWVGKDSAIPNVRGIRSDVVDALREIRVPVVRWPGGCFADKYNWRHGIGPAGARTATVNMWGNVVEPNTFGTDEFMDFAAQIGAEAYININLGSGSPAEAADWLEYMTTDQPSTLGKLRAANGHPAPYKIKYLGIGNESYGCGGGMTADEYVSQYKRYATFASNLNPAQNGPVKFIKSKDAMLDISVGPDSEKIEYTEAVMKAWAQKPAYSWEINGLSLHHYTGGAAGVLASPSTKFGEDEYAASLKNTLKMEELIRIHSAVMDKYDPAKKVGLMVDEWGLWAKPLDGTNFMFLRQQGTLRDAVVAALNLNIFARHADRVQMTNIAQMVNVIHAMILTDGPRMLKTPTFHVYRMYLPFQDAISIPIDLQSDDYRFGEFRTHRVDGIAAKAKDGTVWLALVNLDPAKPTDVTAKISGVSASRAVGEILTGNRVDSGNTFAEPNSVVPTTIRVPFKAGQTLLHLPPASVTVVKLEK